MSHEISSNIIVTDYAGGDDKAAVTWLMGGDPVEELLFVAGPGNRSTAVCHNNLLDGIPEAERALKTPHDKAPQVAYGADTFTGESTRYQTERGSIVYAIHDDLGHDNNDVPPDNSKRSVHIYEKMRETNADVSILSLCATTELPVILGELEGQILDIVIMGGVLGIQGNTAPNQEANFRHDPAATIKTFELARKGNIPIVLVPLDVSEQEGVLFTADRIKYLNGKISHGYGVHAIESVAEKNSLYGDFYMSRVHNEQHFPYRSIPYVGVPEHDLTAAIIQEDFHKGMGIFAYEEVLIQLNMLGQTGVAREYMEPHFRTLVAGDLLDYDKFWQLTAERLAAYQ